MANDTLANNARQRRSRVPSPIVLLVGMVLLISVSIARWYNVRYQRQLSLIHYVEHLGGNIVIVDAEPQWVQEFLVRKLGEDRARGFGEVVRVDLMLTDVNDEDLKRLSGMTDLQHLNLCFTQISDDGLEHLDGLSDLNSLDLRLTRVDDEGLQHLVRLTQLKELWLDGSLVSDEAVDGLRDQLPDCRIHNDAPPFTILF